MWNVDILIVFFSNHVPILATLMQLLFLTLFSAFQSPQYVKGTSCVATLACNLSSFEVAYDASNESMSRNARLPQSEY